MRRLWKWTVRVVLAGIALALIAVIVVVILLHTSWGRNQVRKRVEAALLDQFPGGVHIGSLDGSVFGTLVASDIEIDGADGKPLIRARRVRVKPALLPLLWRTVRVENVSISDVIIDWREQPAKPASPPGPKTPTPWSIDLQRIVVHRAHVSVAGQPLTFDGIEIGASLKIPAGAPLALFVALHGRWVDRSAPIAATVLFQLEDGLPVVPTGSLTIGGVSITANQVRGESGAIVVRGSAEAIAALEPRANLPGDVLIEITADDKHLVSINGAIGATPFEGAVQLQGKPFAARGTIGTHDVDLDTVTRGLIHGRGGATVSFVTNGKQLHATVVAVPRIADLPVHTLVLGIDGTAGGGHVVAFADGPGRMHALASADVTLTKVTRSHVFASVDDPSYFAPEARGALRVSATASGPFATLAFTGTARGRSVRYGVTGVEDLVASFAGRVARPRPYGSAHVELRGISQGADLLGSARVDAKDDGSGRIAVVVHADPRPTVAVDLDAIVIPRAGGFATVDLGTHRVNTPTALLLGTGGHVEITPARIVLKDLRTSTGQGGADITATYRKSDKDLVATIGLQQIELEELISTVSGHLDGTVTIGKRGARWSATGDITGAAVRYGEREPADASLHFVLDGRKLTARATATNPTVGSTDVAIDLVGPVSPFDVEGWKRVPRADLHRLAVAFHKIAPGAVDPRASGTIDGQVELTATDAKGAFAIRGVQAPMGNLDVDLTVLPGAGGEVGLQAQARLTEVGSVELGGRIALPDELFDAPSWRALGRNALRSFSAQIEPIDVTPDILARFHIDAPYHGRAVVQLALGPGGETSRLGVDLTGVMGGAIVVPIDIHAEVATTPTGTSAFANASSNMHELVRVDGQVPVTTDQWLAGGWQRARTAELTGNLEIPSAAAVDVLALVGRAHLTGGSIDGKATIAGTLGVPTVTARFAAHGIAVAASLGDRTPPVLQELVLLATWGGTAGTIDLTGSEAGGGTLHVTAQGDPRALAQAVARVEIGKLDLVPIAAFLPGPYVSLAGQVDGNVAITGFVPATTRLTGQLAVAKGRIPISPTIGTLQGADLVMKLVDRKVEVVLDADLGVNHSTVRNLHVEANGDLAGITATARLRQVSPINKFQPLIDANVVAHLKHDEQWTGDITIRDGHVFVPSKKGTKLLSSTAPDDLIFVDKPTPIPKTFIRPPPEHPNIDVQVDLRSLLVEVEDIARTTVTGNIEVTLGGGGIGMIGAFDAGGSTDLFDRRYDIDHGSVSFDGTMDGLIDIRLVHDFADMTLIAEVGGRVSDPQIDLSSTPATYTRGQLLGFLLGGEPGGDPNAATADAAAGAASSIASGILGSKVRKVVKVIDVLHCESNSTGSTACTVGKWLNEKLFVAGHANLAARPDENRTELEAQYYLRRSIILDLIGGDSSYHSLDVLWRRRW